MTPFQSLRLWARRSPAGERAFAALAATLVLALFGWAAVRVVGSTGSSDGISTAAPGVPAAATGGATGSAATGAASSAGHAAGGGTGPGIATTRVGPVGGSATTGTTRGGAAGAASGTRTTSSTTGCASPQGNDQGVTAKSIKIAVMVPNIVGPAANSAFGVPPASQTKQWYQNVIDSMNASGGIACRKILPQYFNVNPADQNDLQQKCYDVVSAGVFATLDEGGYGPFPQKDCYAQHHIPFFTGYPITGQEAQKFYPYLFANSRYEDIYRNTVFALRDRGFFNPAKGFRKLGFVYNNCYKYLITDMLNWLHQAGLTDSQIDTYDMGCSSTTMPTPADEEQAVHQFQLDGVTHVTVAEFVGGFWSFTRIAEQQRFRPRYGIPDDQIVAISYGSNSPDPNNIDGALAITPFRNGEEKVPGYPPSPGTVRCNAIFAKAGQPPVYRQQSAVGGTACDELWVLKAAVEHAPVLSREALAAGLQASGSLELSYPDGPGDLSGNRNTAWMDHWRADQFSKSCTCWKVVDRTFHPSYS